MAKMKFYKVTQSLAARTDLTCTDKIILAIIIDHIGKNACR